MHSVRQMPDEICHGGEYSGKYPRGHKSQEEFMIPATKRVSVELEDALTYLSRKAIVEYKRGQVIYDAEHFPTGISLIVQGRVKVAITLDDGSQTVTGIYSTDDFFGESCLLGADHRQERAVALE